MPRTVRLPDGRLAEFPDEFSNDQIESVLNQQFPEWMPQKSFWEGRYFEKDIPHHFHSAMELGTRGLETITRLGAGALSEYDRLSPEQQEYVKSLGKEADEYLSGLEQEFGRLSEKYYLKPEGFWDWASYLGAMPAQFAPTMVGGLTAGVPGVLGTAYLLGTGEVSGELERAGKDPMDPAKIPFTDVTVSADQLSAIMGVPMAVIEAAGGPERMLRRLMSGRLAGRGLLNKVLRAGAESALTEAPEEFAQKYVTGITARVNEGKPLDAEFWRDLSIEGAKEGIMVAPGAALVGGGMGVFSRTAEEVPPPSRAPTEEKPRKPRKAVKAPDPGAYVRVDLGGGAFFEGTFEGQEEAEGVDLLRFKVGEEIVPVRPEDVEGFEEAAAPTITPPQTEGFALTKEWQRVPDDATLTRQPGVQVRTDKGYPEARLSPDTELPQASMMPGFYSGLQRAVEEVPQETARAEQWLGTLRKRPGVTPDELAWTTLPEYLEARKGERVTKGDILGHLRRSPLVFTEQTRQYPEGIQEEFYRAAADRRRAANEAMYMRKWANVLKVQYGEEAALPVYELARRFEDESTRLLQRRQELLDQGAGGLPWSLDMPQYPSMALPGGQNYREIILRFEGRGRQVEIAEQIQKNQDEISALDRKRSGPKLRETITKQRELHEENERLFAENLALERGMGDYAQETYTPDWREGHGFPANTFAWVRAQDRTLLDGRRALEVQEIQSDWHQEGAESGYLPQDPMELETRINNAANESARLAEEVNFLVDSTIFGEQHANVSESVKQQAGDWAVSALFSKGHERGYAFENMRAWLRGHVAPNELSNIERRLEERGDEIRDAVNKSDEAMKRKVALSHLRDEGVPDAPLRKKWPELAAKAAIRQAVEGGYDSVIFPGNDEYVRRAEGEDPEWLAHEPIRNRYFRNIPKFLKSFTKRFNSTPRRIDYGPILREQAPLYAPLEGHTAPEGIEVPITEEMRRSVQDKGLPYFQEARRSPDTGVRLPRPEAREVIERIVKQMTGGRATVVLTDERITMTAGSAFGPQTAAVGGFSWYNMVQIALDPEYHFSPTNIGVHEAIHWLQQNGIWTPEEADLVEAELPRMREITAEELGMAPEQAERIPDIEAVAYTGAAYLDWKYHGRKSLPSQMTPKLKRLFNKLYQFFERLGNALRGRGFQTLEDVFERAYGGEIVARGVQPTFTSVPAGMEVAPLLGPTKPGRYLARALVTVRVDGEELTFADAERGASQYEALTNMAFKWPESATIRIMNFYSGNDATTQQNEYKRMLTDVGVPPGFKSPNLQVAARDMEELPKRAGTLPRAEDLGKITGLALHPRHIVSSNKYREAAPAYYAGHKLLEDRSYYAAEAAKPFIEFRSDPDEVWNNAWRALETMRLHNIPYRGQRQLVVQNPQTNEVIALSERETALVKAWEQSRATMLNFWKNAILTQNGLPPNARADQLKKLKEIVQLPENVANRIDTVITQIQEIDALGRRAYVPFVRIGDVAISVHDAEGKQVHFEMVRTRGIDRIGAADRVERRRRELAEQYPDGSVSNAFIPTHDMTMLEGLDGLSAFEMLTTALARSDPEFYREARPKLEGAAKDALTRQGFSRHLRPALEIPGYSNDMREAIGMWINSAAFFASRMKNFDELSGALRAIPARKAKLREYMQNWANYIQSPQEEWQHFRALAFAWQLGARPSSALVNLSSYPVFVGPILAALGGARAHVEFTRAIGSAMRMAAWSGQTQGVLFDPRKFVGPEDMKRDFIRAYEDGVIGAQQTTQLIGLTELPGERIVGESPGPRLRSTGRKTMQLATTMFQTTEVGLRAATYIATHRLLNTPAKLKRADTLLRKESALWDTMRKQGVEATPDSIGRFVIQEWVGEFGKINRPRLFRKGGAPVFIFASWPMQMYEAMWRIAKQGGPRGQMAFGYMLGMMMILAGWQGLPLMEDTKDLLEWLIKFTGTNTDIDTAVRRATMSMFNDEFVADAVSRGIPYASLDVDVSRRIGMGQNPVVPVGELVSEQGLGVGEALGVPGSMLIRAPNEAFTRLKTGQGLEAALTPLLPVVMQDILKAHLLAERGYVTARGNRMVLAEDLDESDIIQQMFGWRPKKLSEASEIVFKAGREADPYAGRRSGYYMRLATNIADQRRAKQKGDDEEYRRLRKTYNEMLQEIREHNQEATSPEELIIIDPRHLRLLTLQQLYGKSDPRVLQLQQRRAGRPATRELLELYEE